MKTQKVPAFDSFVVFSDVHLRDPNDSLTKTFIAALKQQTQVEAIFLLGDIFDFFGASKPFFFKRWQGLFDTFCELRSLGIKIYFLEGNHDFGFEHFPSPRLDKSFDVYGDMRFEMQHPILGRVLFLHGDNMICPPSYLPFRKLIKSKWFQKLTNFLVPGFLVHLIFSRYAKISRKKDVYRTLERTFFEACVQRFLNRQSAAVDVLIFGHIHATFDETYGETRLLCGPDWFQAPSYLLFNQTHQFERVFLVTEGLK